MNQAVWELNPASLSAFQSLILPEAGLIWQDPSADIVAFGIVNGEQPAGLVLALLAPNRKAARLLSIMVRSDMRRRGLGKQLMLVLEHKLRELGYVSLQVEFLAAEDLESEEGAFLQACGFPSPEQGMYIRRGRLRAVEDAPWMKLALPASFSLEPWRDVTPHDRALIQTEAGKEYPDVLSPFADEDRIDPVRSLLLRYQGQPAGWLILEELDAETILLKTMYVYRKHQRLARGIALGSVVLRKLIDERKYQYGALCVEQENEPMVRFLLRHISGPRLSKEVLWRASKSLLTVERS
ncbi:GNAT family N-acetyltransferase [Paenibacillus hexagrammi]|uniref:GNAT family N-acetyltransferase n=1 Tax=Paenibacillus hexagrammi TaxID=2908839 RepID=A0ABY3SDY1_9BACL|nr:GNAT family N-acetyltransferase [Paenibacillus sp. YPD9-1]UJF32189.1 GNAT family N-acetyltransferase [Paenibacillus sp. YPD9-1]